MSLLLSNSTSSRDNNFNLIRILAAWGVLVSHSYVLSTGTPASEPLTQSLGMSLGTLCVDIFFITSGFLVTGSLVSRRSVVEFAWARALRIYPALIVMVVLVTLGLGTAFTKYPLTEYFSNPLTRDFLLRNSIFYTRAAYVLPGVFEALPYKNVVNGSLWTLFYEIRMYGILALTWWLSSRIQALRGSRFRWVMLGATIVGLAAYEFTRIARPETASPFWHLFFMFFSGGAYFAFKEKILLNFRLFLPLAAALVIGSFFRDVFQLIYPLIVGYVLLYIAYAQTGFLKKYNALGDYSYGVYIYAFPVQQSIVSLNPGIAPLQLLVWSTVVTLPLAVLSWHLVEKQALTLKSMIRTRRSN